MDVNQFLSGLVNLEKTRNFNVFKEYSLNTFQSVLENFGLIDQPENILRISVVGTNGKGSVSHYLSQIAFRSNKFSTVGLYTSPHLLTQNERIQVNGNLISDDWMNAKLNSFSSEELKRLKTLSYFEFFTFLAILFFKDNRCNLEVFEAGLGGRLDATKLTYPDIVVLTKIALDHTSILGDSEEKILLEKLEIVTENTNTIYTFQQDENLMRIIESFCKERSLDLIINPYRFDKDYLSFNKEFALFLINSILEKQNRKGIEKKIFDLIPMPPGRMQVLRTNPILLFDIAHNPSAIRFLLKSLPVVYPKEIHWRVYLGCLKDKDIKKILEVFIGSHIIEKVYQVIGEDWNKEIVSSPKIETISEEQFLEALKNFQNTSLVVGSFRLYPLVINNVF